MNVFKKILSFNVFYKKLILFGIIIILAIPLSFFMIKNFQENLEKSKNKKFFKEFKSEEAKKKKNEFQAELGKIGEMIKQSATSSTTTD